MLPKNVTLLRDASAFQPWNQKFFKKCRSTFVSYSLSSLYSFYLWLFCFLSSYRFVFVSVSFSYRFVQFLWSDIQPKLLSLSFIVWVWCLTISVAHKKIKSKKNWKLKILLWKKWCHFICCMSWHFWNSLFYLGAFLLTSTHN